MDRKAMGQMHTTGTGPECQFAQYATDLAVGPISVLSDFMEKYQRAIWGGTKYKGHTYCWACTKNFSWSAAVRAKLIH